MCNCNCHNQNNSSRANTTIISSEAGNDGLSAYQIAVNTGLFTGTEIEYIEWLKGTPAKSNYELAVESGQFEGTEAEFIEWNRGEEGPQGDTYIPVFSNNIFNS